MRFRHHLFFALFAGIASCVGVSSAQASQQNYTCPDGPQSCAPGQSYAPIMWGDSCLKFYLDRAGSPDFRAPGETGVSGALEQIVLRSFETWSQPACSGVTLSYQGQIDVRDEAVDSGHNIVSFEPPESFEISATTFASTFVTYNPNTGIIRDADIYINNEFYQFVDGPAPGSGTADLQNTLTHEIGHFLGFAHSEVPEASMFGGAILGDMEKRTLHNDDIELLCQSYPVEEASFLCEHPGSTVPPVGPGVSREPDSGKFDNPSEPGYDPGAVGGDTAQAGCNVTGAPASVTLGPWLFIFGLLLAGWNQIRGHKRPRRVRRWISGSDN